MIQLALSRCLRERIDNIEMALESGWVVKIHKEVRFGSVKRRKRIRYRTPVV